MNVLLAPTNFDLLPPQSVETEQLFLGSLLLVGLDAAAVAHARTLLRRDDFYLADHQIIYDAICRMHDHREAVDIPTLREHLSREGLLEDVGGQEYLVRLIGGVPFYMHYPTYAKTIREKSLWRQAIMAANEVLRAAYLPRNGPLVEEAEGVLTETASLFSRIAAGGKADQVHQIGDVARELLARRDSGAGLRVSTGIQRLDEMTGGLRKGSKTIVGAKPSMGKSCLIKQLARNIASRGTKVGIITIEESRHKVAENVLAAVSQVPNNRIAFGTATEAEWGEIEAAVETVRDLPLYVVDSARKLTQIIAVAHVLACQYGCEVIAVDHLHIIDGESEENRNNEITKISAGLKQAWKDLNVAGIEAAQLNRNGGSDRPTLASLRDSGSLEADGDVVILLHRDDYYRRTTGDPLDGILELIVAKNKDGAAATVFTHLDEARQTIRDLEPHEKTQGVDPTEGIFD